MHTVVGLHWATSMKASEAWHRRRAGLGGGEGGAGGTTGLEPAGGGGEEAP